MINSAGMKTDSEFPDVYLDFIRQNGIPSYSDVIIAKPEMVHEIIQKNSMILNI
jgi:hypothetical protein